MVREERLELSQVTPLEPKSSASTNSATLAKTVAQITRYLMKSAIIDIDLKEN